MNKILIHKNNRKFLIKRETQKVIVQKKQVSTSEFYTGFFGANFNEESVGDILKTTKAGSSIISRVWAYNVKWNERKTAVYQ